MVDDRQLAKDALLQLEAEDLRHAALAMLYSTSHGAHLQQMVLKLRETAALAGAVRAFTSQHQAGVQPFWWAVLQYKVVAGPGHV